MINDNDIDTYGVQSEIFKVTELILTRLLEQEASNKNDSFAEKTRFIARI
jgi:hypothetical protein